MKGIRIVNKSGNPLPSYATEGAAGFDLRADMSEGSHYIAILPNQSAVVPTGLYMELPLDHELQIRSRSGLAAKQRVVVLNSPATIDCDYRGEIKVISFNHGNKRFVIKQGDRIAQGVLNLVAKQPFIEVDSLSVTDRGEGGFGSTGV